MPLPQTIDDLCKWLRTTDGWYVNKHGCIRRDGAGQTSQCPASAPIATHIWDISGIGDAYEDKMADQIVAASDGWTTHDRNLRRRLARACRVKLSERRE